MANNPKENSKSENQNAQNSKDNKENAVSYNQLNREVPLAAKDSEWIGLKTTRLDTHCFFPDVEFNTKTESTTVITKLLVGHNPDASLLPKHKKLFRPNNLPSVKEQTENLLRPSESSVDIKSVTCSEIVGSEEGHPYDIEDDDDEPKRATHKKRRKKKSDVGILHNDESSSSILEVPIKRNSSSRSRQASKTRQATHIHSALDNSNDADDEYMTHSEDKLADKL